MKTGKLLEKLICIAKMPKTDFALNMHMTPSGLSKILTGKRLPILKEKKAFSKQAALYLAETIYDYNCYMKLEETFPVIYDFSSKYEFEIFLASAIEYSIDRDFIEGNSENKDYPDTETSFIGKKAVLNMVCILLSDQITNAVDETLPIYSTLPLFHPSYSDTFVRLKTIALKNWKILSTNHIFNYSLLDTIFDKYGMTLLSSIPKLYEFANVDLWVTEEKMESYFVLLKNHILLAFNVMSDGTPLLTAIRHKSYLSTFFTNLMKKKIRKISYNRSEASALLEKNPGIIDKFLSKGVDAVYNFISLGYLLERHELDVLDGKDIIKDSICKLFNYILTKETPFTVTLDAMTGFFATGKAIAPLLGAVSFSQEDRLPYLERFSLYLDQEKADKLQLVNCDMPHIAVICSPRINIVYYIDSTYQSERFYYFETDKINKMLKSKIADGSLKTLDFNEEVWNYYVDELKTGVHPTGF
ncbi:hypothetical protein [Clostridium sp. C105KSO13]|uniref:hypothetical protein n=1 Tax=Clostridium sp. C105KSO13 TaxID=1776045 RepID=UPI0007408141|nr:hypothetical protein [Clostridium sp. C105KSO13]CUX33892.1 hypothetical protein BN3456_01519 [Clostridium sp. C105KSO13]